jgi:hypothetical protein
MSKTGIYLLQTSGDLVEMSEQEYDSEDLLQRLLEQYPSLLAGDQIDEANPRKWLLISREASIPDDENNAGRWSVDHVFLDQDGVPTLVEVKRSSDTRIRREVVGQMLDYAANSVVYWSQDKIQVDFEANCGSKGIDPSEELFSRLEIETDYEAFWNDVRTNLRAGRVRLVFVADEIPPELKRIVEFLNEQMDPAEVLAVEIKQFVGGDQKTLVPRVFGKTAKTQKKSGSTQRETRRWDRHSFLSELDRQKGSDSTAIAKSILSWVDDKGLRIWWGKGQHTGSFFPMFDVNGQSFSMFSFWTNGGIEIQFKYMIERPVFGERAKRLGLLTRLNAIEDIDIPEDGIERRPSIDCHVLKDQARLMEFLQIWQEYMDEIRSNSQETENDFSS